MLAMQSSGCGRRLTQRTGKTTVAVALRHLFGFAHVQSDDVQAKKAAPIFLKNVTEALKTNNVVIADKCVHPFSRLLACTVADHTRIGTTT